MAYSFFLRAPSVSNETLSQETGAFVNQSKRFFQKIQRIGVASKTDLLRSNLDSSYLTCRTDLITTVSTGRPTNLSVS